MIYTGFYINFMIKHKAGILKIVYYECGYLYMEPWVKHFANIWYVPPLPYVEY